MSGCLQVLMGGGLSAPTVSAFPASVLGSTTTNFGTAATTSTTASVTGGIAPFAYAWQYVSGDNTTVATSATAASTTFRASVSSANPIRTSTWRCQVTDSAGQVAYSNNVSVELDYNGT